MDKMIVLYLEAITRIIANSQEKEESFDGLVLQLAMLEKIKEILTTTILRTNNQINKYIDKEKLSS